MKKKFVSLVAGLCASAVILGGTAVVAFKKAQA